MRQQSKTAMILFRVTRLFHVIHPCDNCTLRIGGISCVLLLLTFLCSCNFPSSSQSSSLPTVTTKYGVDLSTIQAFDSVVVDIVVDGVAQGHSVYTVANEDAASHKIRWEIKVPETKVVKMNALIWLNGDVIATQSETFTSGQAPRIPTITLGPMLFTKYSVDLSAMPAFDSVTTDIVVDGATQGGHSQYVPANMDAAHKVYWVIKALQGKTVKVNAVVWHQGIELATQTETFASGQTPQMPAPILAPTVTLPASDVNWLSLYPSGTTVSATSNSTSAYITALSLDFESDGTIDTTISGGVGGVATLSISNAKMYNTVVAGTYTTTVTVTDVLGRSFSHKVILATGDFDRVTDSRDGQAYLYRKIGSQTWMLKNLAYVPAGSAGASTWCYNNDPANCATYGVLYNYQAALTACPTGWHLPDTTEWNTLETTVGGSAIAGTVLKSTSGWTSGGITGTNAYGFSALSGGYYYGAAFGIVGDYGNWWTATPNGTSDAYTRYMYCTYAGVYHGSDGQADGFSARCLKD